MNHYTMLQSAIPDIYLKSFIQACTAKLEYFIESPTLLGENKLHSIDAIDEVFDLNNSTEFKTLAITINPYQRVHLFFLEKMIELHNLKPGTGVDFTVYKNEFPKYVEEYLTVKPNETPYSTKNSYNGYHGQKATVNYLLEFNTFLPDLKTIPEFADETIDYMQAAQDDGANYRDFYDDATKAKVAEVFAEDLAGYGYKF